ncbi:MAG: L,D-transpeptidase [Sphingomonas sp.]
MILRWPVALLLALSITGPALGQSTIAPIDGIVDQLKPGEYLWAPQIAPEGPVVVIVSLTAQRAYAYRNGVVIGVSTVSSGKPGHSTPTGVFTILQKDIDHKSNVYSDAPMPFMLRLTWRGIAMHAGNLPGYPASHGCVRFPLDFAKLLYGVTKLGMTVVITAAPTVPVVVATAPLLSDGPDDRVIGRATGYEWHPERSPTGPVSIVISGSDRQMIVLRNGVKIASSGIVLAAPVVSTAAFSLVGIDGAGQRWLRLPLPGQETASDTEVTPDEQAKGHLPPRFKELLATVLVPGTTLLVTRDTLRAAHTGQSLTVIATERP